MSNANSPHRYTLKPLDIVLVNTRPAPLTASEFSRQRLRHGPEATLFSAQARRARHRHDGWKLDAVFIQPPSASSNGDPSLIWKAQIGRDIGYCQWKADQSRALPVRLQGECFR